jgi:hypothetical protein
MIVPSMIVREHRHQTIYERMAHRTLGCLLGSAVALNCVRVLGTDLPAMALILAGGIWLDYSIQTGREAIPERSSSWACCSSWSKYPGQSRTRPWMDRLLGILIGSAILYLLIWIDPKRAVAKLCEAGHLAISKSYHVRQHRILETSDVCVHVWVNKERLTTPEA